MKLKALGINLLLALFTFIIVFFIADRLVTAYLNKNFKDKITEESEMNIFFGYDPILGFRGIPNVDAAFQDVTISHNSMGFRCAELSPPEEKNVRRVVLTGDSQQWGYGLEDDQTLAFYLDSLLNRASDDPWEVVNLGVSGYSTTQAYLSYLYLGTQFQPEILIHSHFPNDCGDNGTDVCADGLSVPHVVMHKSEGDLYMSGIPVIKHIAFYNKSIYYDLNAYLEGSKHLIFRISWNYIKEMLEYYRFKQNDIDVNSFLSQHSPDIRELSSLSFANKLENCQVYHDGEDIAVSMINALNEDANKANTSLITLIIPNRPLFPELGSCGNHLIDHLDPDEHLYIDLRHIMVEKDFEPDETMFYGANNIDNHLSVGGNKLSADTLFNLIQDLVDL